MKIQRMPEDIVPLLNDLVRRLTALETRPLGTVFVNETIVAKDPETGVETVIGDLSEYGEDRTGIKQWVNDTEPPAVPVMPIVTSNLGVFSVVWTGFFENDAPMAPDFSHLNVYGNNGTSTKLVGVIKTKDEVAIVTLDSEAMYDEVWSFWFTSVDQVGNESVPGPISANNQLTPLVESPDIQGAIDKVYEKIEKDFEKSMLAANGKNRIWHTPEPPVEDPNAPFIDGDMWFDTNNGNKIHVWKNLPEPGAWEAAVLDSSALDDKVTDLIEDAKNQADVALETANGKNKSYHQPTAPSGTNHRVGDIWFDTDDSNKVYVWNGTKWDPSTASSEIPQSVLDDILYAKNKSDQAYSLANGKNKRVDSINNPPANTTGYIAGDHWLKWSNLGTTGVLLQSWTVKNGAWVLDSMDPTYLPKVDIGQGTFGSLNGDRLIANTVSAEKILIGSFDNVIADPLFTNNAEDWLVGTNSIYTFDPTGGRGGISSIKITPNGATSGKYSKRVPAEAGDSFRVTVWVKSNVVIPKYMVYTYANRIAVGSTGVSNAEMLVRNAEDIPANTWYLLEGNYTVPENTSNIGFGPFVNSNFSGNSVWFSEMSAIRMSGATLIENGAITTEKIKAGSITAESGIIASLDAGKIVTGSMHGKYIEAGTLLASKLAVRNNENLLPNLTYEAEDWVLSGGTTIVNSTLSSEGKRLSFPPTALAQAIAYDVQVIPGEKYKVEANTYGTTATQNLEICWFGKDGKGVGAGSSALIKSTTTNQKLSTEWEVPANVFSVRFSIRVPSTSPVNTSATGAYSFTVRKMTGTVLIENGAVTADQIKSGTITADSGVIASLDASKITVGEMDGKLIKANSILADRLVVGDFENYATVDPVLKTNVSHSSYKTETVGDYASAIGSGSYFMFRNPSNSVPFELGDKLRVTFDAKSSNTSNQNVTAQLWTYLGLNGSGGGAAYFPGTSTTITPTEKRYEMFIEVTSDISAAKSWIVGLSQAGSKNVLLRNITVRRMAKGELIVDGAILANHIHADSVEARHIKANAVTADKIEAGAVKTSHLAVGTGRELIGNGSGQLKNNNGFEGFRYSVRSSNTPLGHPGHFYTTAGQGTTNFLTGDNILRVKPNTKYKVSVWIRANTSGSNIYLEPMTGSTATGDRTNPVYPFQQLEVPTAWTYWSTEFTTGGADAGTMYFRWFLNHSTGTNTNAIIYFTGFSVEEMVEGTIISDGAITTDKIAANTITAEKMTIGVGSNLFPDPLIKDDLEWVGPNISIVPNGGRNASGNAMRITSVGAQRGTYYGTTMNNRRIPVVPGRSYRVTAWIKPSTNTSVGSNFSMYGRLYSQDGTTSIWTSPSSSNASYITNVASISSSTWTKFESEFLVPEDSANTFLAPGFYIQSGYPSGNTLDWCDISVTEMSSGELIVDGAIDGKTITGALIQTDKEANKGIKLRNEGLEVYSPEGEKTLSITAGQGVDFIGIWGHKDATIDEATGTIKYPSGVVPEQVASISATGEVASNYLSVAEMGRFDGNITMDGEPLQDSHLGTEAPGEFGPVMSGRSLLGSTFKEFVDQHPQVSDVTSWLTPLSHGFIANAYANTTPASQNSGRWTWSGLDGGLIDRMMIQDTVEIVNNRGYIISYNAPAIRETTSGNNSSVGACVLRYTLNNTLNINGGTVVQNSRTYIAGGGDYSNPGRTIFVVGGQDLPAGTVTLGLQVYTYEGRRMETTGTADARYWNISVIDVGLATKGNTGKTYDLYRRLPASSGGNEETSPPPPKNDVKPKPKQYTKTWNASWYGTWWVGNGNGTNSYYNSSGKVTQGRPPGVGYNQRGLIGFPNMTGTLSGSSIKKVEVYVYAAHWYSSSGGTLRIATHGNTSKPTTVTANPTIIKTQKLAKPEGRWVTLPSSTHAGLLNGNVRGIHIYNTSTGASGYGYLTGSKSKIRVTYTK